MKELEEQRECVCVKFCCKLGTNLKRYFNCLTKHTLVALSSRSALSVLIGALFKKFGLFLNTCQYTLGKGTVFEAVSTYLLVVLVEVRRE
jgi:hypothetical protein